MLHHTRWFIIRALGAKRVPNGAESELFTKLFLAKSSRHTPRTSGGRELHCKRDNPQDLAETSLVKKKLAFRGAHSAPRVSQEMFLMWWALFTTVRSCSCSTRIVVCAGAEARGSRHLSS